MLNNHDKHYLGVAIESDLYNIVSEIKKSNREDKEELVEDLINNFIDKYKNAFPSVTEEEFRLYIDEIFEKTKETSESHDEER